MTQKEIKRLQKRSSQLHIELCKVLKTLTNKLKLNEIVEIEI